MPAATATPRSAPAPAGAPALGVLDSVRLGLATAAKTIRTRLDIISTELEEQREWLQNLVLLAVVGVFCACMGLVMVTLFVVAIFWESHPVAVLGGFSALYLGVGVWALMAFRGKMESRPKLFSTTNGELAKDEARLTPKS